MKITRILLTVLMCALVWLSVTSCFFNSSPVYINTKNTRNIHMIVKMNKGDYWNTVKLGAEAAAKEFNVNLTFKAPDSESMIDEQVAMVEDSITQHADAIILAASSYMGLAQVVDQAAYSKIPVISVDAEVGSAKVRAYVGSNGYEAGQKSAERLITLLNGTGEIGILNFTSASLNEQHVSGSIDYGARDADEREKGFLNYAARYPNIDVVQISYTSSNTTEAEALTRQMLEKHPGLRGIATLNETASQGAGKVIQSQGLDNIIKMVAFDSSPSMLELLQNGTVQATVIQNPFSNGYLAVKYAVEAVQGMEVPERVDTGTKLIDLDNMLYPENQKLLFPFVR
ncbi:substrate-binding domain-containing protein [Paenibacillus sp. FSL R7-0331]|uniref:substrate-binding domain-containing protein n=1 Tax=Paenibacillus sp. FSL R7-0331 TaxID=1536773 RepID=UPI0004F81B72|nr:substrate-binding domain-containing protein [Paenibacillus sp. FSL R7-0331]AIQ53588.1 LacI family transcriptional regulator [Paenibacillus sp. FSL R7-0331]